MNGFVKAFVNSSQFKRFQNMQNGFGYTNGNEYWNIEIYIPIGIVNIDNNKISWIGFENLDK